MNLPEKISTTVALLPESKQVEVLDFVEHLKLKEENSNWNDFSIASAMRGIENETDTPKPYTAVK